MKKFKFSMQKILDLREFEKQQAQTDLGKAVAEETRIKNTLEMVAQQRVGCIKTADGTQDISQSFAINQYIRLLDQRKEKLLEELTQAQMITEQKREAMKEAMQKVRVLEKLKESRQEEWAAEKKKAEEKEIDEINNSIYAR